MSTANQALVVCCLHWINTSCCFAESFIELKYHLLGPHTSPQLNLCLFFVVRKEIYCPFSVMPAPFICLYIYYTRHTWYTLAQGHIGRAMQSLQCRPPWYCFQSVDVPGINQSMHPSQALICVSIPLYINSWQFIHFILHK